MRESNKGFIQDLDIKFGMLVSQLKVVGDFEGTFIKYVSLIRRGRSEERDFYFL